MGIPQKRYNPPPPVCLFLMELEWVGKLALLPMADGRVWLVGISDGSGRSS